MARVFERANAQVYAVGGAVRNALLGVPASDMDMCGAARPAEVLALCEGTEVRAVQRAAHFGTTELHVSDADGRHMAEYTTFRVDSYRSGHRPESVRFADTPAEDALRRDFSMNALYRPLTADGAGDLLDPTGGLDHMRAGALHTVTPDPDAVLKDDGLRILRAARFQAELGYRPTDALLASARRHAPLLADIAPERLREELVKTLLADVRYPRSASACGAAVAPRAPAASDCVNGALADDRAGSLCSDGLPAHCTDLRRSADMSADCAASLCSADDPADPFLPQLPSSVSAGLRTLHAVDAWRSLFGDLAFDDEAVAALERYAAPSGLPAVSGKLALLMRRAAPDDLANVMRRLRFSVRETDAARRLLALTRALVDGALTRFAAVQAGASALSHARSAFAALGDARLTAAASDLLALLPRYPSSLKLLAVNGDDLLPLARAAGAPANRVGMTLAALWQAVVADELPNAREPLLTRARALLRGDEGRGDDGGRWGRWGRWEAPPPKPTA